MHCVSSNPVSFDRCNQHISTTGSHGRSEGLGGFNEHLLNHLEIIIRISVDEVAEMQKN